MSFAERLKIEKKDRHPSEITMLRIDNVKATEIDGLTDEYVNLEALILVSIGLKSLKGLPKLPSLKQLDVSDNQLSGGLEVLGSSCPILERLSLSNNSFDNVDALKPLAQLRHLISLDVFHCPISDEPTYRENVFQLIPHLKYLDGLDADNMEESDFEEEDEEDEDDECVEVSDDEEGEDSEGEGEGDESFSEDEVPAQRRGVKRKFPQPNASEEEYTGDSAPANE